MKGSKEHEGSAQDPAQEETPGATPPDSAAEEKDAIPVESLTDIHALREKAQKSDEHYDNYLRAVAELENYRKRAIKDRAHYVEAAQMVFIQGLLPIVDNLQRALSQIGGQSDAKSVQEGLGLIGRQVEAFLESVGLKTFSSVGEKFDPHKHEAVLHVPSKEQPDHTVLEEVQKGYSWQGRIVRHALVKVADNPQTPTIESAGKSPEGHE